MTREQLEVQVKAQIASAYEVAAVLANDGMFGAAAVVLGLGQTVATLWAKLQPPAAAAPEPATNGAEPPAAPPLEESPPS